MSGTPLVSVVIPAYQAGATIGGAISSALCQTYGHIEVVVCNDGSTDATSAIAHAYGPPVTVIDQGNAGVSVARNAGITAARGEFVTLLDADDQFMPHHVERCMAARDAAGGGQVIVAADAVFLSARGIAPGMHFYHRRPPEDLAGQRLRMLEGNVGSIYSLFPRRMWEELGGFDTTLEVMEDYDFWLRAVFAGWRMVVLDEPTAICHLTSGSLSGDVGRMRHWDKVVRRRLRETRSAELSAAERDLLDLSLESESVSEYVEQAADELARGRAREASRLLDTASRLTPSDHRLRLKARVLRWAPAAGRVYAAREARRLAWAAR